MRIYFAARNRPRPEPGPRVKPGEGRGRLRTLIVDSELMNRAAADRLATLAPALAIGASALALAAALASEHLGGLRPCILCLYQRWPYVAAILLGLSGLVLRDRPQPLRGVLALAGIAFLVGAGIAAFHVGVEQHWWEGTASCGGTLETGLTLEELREKLLGTPVVRCDEVAFALFGISMAGYNLIYATACGVASLLAASRLRP